MGILSASGGSVMPGPQRVYCEFRQDPVHSGRLGTAATGVAGDRNAMAFGGHGLVPGVVFSTHVKGTQTILAPVTTVDGLDVGSQDQTADDGIEINLGINRACPCGFLVGTDAFFVKAYDVVIADVSGTDDFAFGFRKAEANQANVDDYDEMAVINVIAGAIKGETILNNAATVTTDPGVAWADGAKKSLMVTCDVARRVRLYYSADVAFDADLNFSPVAWTEINAGTAYSFDSGEIVVPFVFFLQDTDIAGVTTIRGFDSGLS